MSRTTDFSIVQNELRIESSGSDVKFKWPIAKVLDFVDILVVCLEPEVGACFNENVFGVDLFGRIVWTIDKRKHVYDDSPYTSIIKKGDLVQLFNWDGDELLVDPKTGKVMSVGYGK
jgi:hypothetical protein